MSFHLSVFRQSVPVHLILPIYLLRSVPGLVLLSFCWQPVLFLSVCARSPASVYRLATCPVPVCLCPITCFCLQAGNLWCSYLSVSCHLVLYINWQPVLFLSVCVRSPASFYTLATSPVPVCLCPIIWFCLSAGNLSCSCLSVSGWLLLSIRWQTCPAHACLFPATFFCPPAGSLSCFCLPVPVYLPCV